MKSIALGQYYPAKSLLHRLDPRAKVILAFVYIICSFLCKNVISFAALVVSAILVILLSRIPLRIVYSSIKPLIFILLFTVLINVFWTTGETLLFEWKFIRIYLEGVMNAVFMIVRILTLIVGTSMFLTYTTTPIALTDALEQLLAPLKKIKVPVHEFAMMMTIALRFIPTLLDETDRIMKAQTSRGADFASGNIFQRMKNMLPLLVPLFISAFRRADELAVAMEARCYRGGEGRTRMHELVYAGRDYLAFALIIILAVGLAVLRWGNICVQ